MMTIQRSLSYLSQSAAIAGVLFLAACSTPVKVAPAAKEVSKPVNASNSALTPKIATSTAPALPKANSGRGGYYQDDGPGDDIPEGLESTVDPIPVVEPYSRTGNKPYKVFGKEYTPINDSTTPYKQRGIASWYGKKFHGKRTSSGEPYDMYKMTAAHPLLPIPSYARVTNLSNGKQIIVRINDRGPFHSSRIMDLSYTAALKLGYLGKGSSEVELERLLPEDIARMAENSQNQVAQNASPSRTISASNPPATVATVATSAAADKDGLTLETMIAAQERKLQTEIRPVTLSEQTVKAETKPQNSSEANVGSGGANFYLQFAAFAIRANAETSMTQLKQVLKNRESRGEVGAEVNLEIVQQGNLYRLQSGPYTQRDAAQRAAQELAVGSAKPIVIQR
ncbi:septal ring lytic transglycosylase RlpA family protein [Undibacterium flavidum]|uniref:Endolytic peptidoglycan transglycosylase RlpA n=1 Tax=Undibacterium flavidum TaxID=2762297 RepID=A0ABR6Y8U4_9BURK|nr:septal ring lytic transglycosylase RlpA family protein [Undibacterium flavidum]MBC3873035.1 septal ring lytic transglycosylase RlpA family protein [Undibacterium flavidum]